MMIIGKYKNHILSNFQKHPLALKKSNGLLPSGDVTDGRKVRHKSALTSQLHYHSKNTAPI